MVDEIFNSWIGAFSTLGVLVIIGIILYFIFDKAIK